MDGRRIRQLLLAIGAVVLLRVALFAVLDAVAPYEGTEMPSRAVELVHDTNDDAVLPLFPAPGLLHDATEMAALDPADDWTSDDRDRRDPGAARRGATPERTIARFRD